jgi:hypothetical protein
MQARWRAIPLVSREKEVHVAGRPLDARALATPNAE